MDMPFVKICQGGSRHHAPSLPSAERAIKVSLGDRSVIARNDSVPAPPLVPRLDALTGDVGRRRLGTEPGTSELIAGLISVVTSLSARLDHLERSHRAAST